MAQQGTTSDDTRMQGRQFMLRSKFLRFFGGAYTLFNPDGQPVLYAEMKRFRLREDIRLYDDASKTYERLSIRTQSVFDFNGAYDVVDSVTDERVGTLQRAGFKSTFMQDHWMIRDIHGQTIAELTEDSTLKALLRRFVEYVALLLPQRYEMRSQNQVVARYNQRFNPFIYKLDITFEDDSGVTIDRRLALAMAILLAAIEGRQG